MNNRVAGIVEVEVTYQVNEFDNQDTIWIWVPAHANKEKEIYGSDLDGHRGVETTTYEDVEVTNVNDIDMEVMSQLNIDMVPQDFFYYNTKVDPSSFEEADTEPDHEDVDEGRH